MTNDLNTITGVLAEAVDKLEANLNSMGVYATYDPTEGYLALLDEILNIAPSVGGINLSTAISLTNTPSVVKAHDTVLLSATVHADYDDRSQANIDMNGYLQGATVSFYDGNTLLGTGVTGADGVATFTVTDISYGSHSFKAEYDGTGTSYDSAVSSVLNVTAEHDYSLEFGQDTYTASAGSCNVTVTLLDNGVPVVGETVSLTGSDSSLYSGITNSQGIATFNLTGLTSSATWTCSYSNVSDTCTVTVQSYLFYDDCSSSSRLSEYGSSVSLTNNRTSTLTYDSTENAYLFERSTSGDCFTGFALPLPQTDNIKISLKVKLRNTSAYCQMGLWEQSSSSTYELIRLRGDRIADAFKNDSNSSIVSYTNVANFTTAYYTLEISYTGSTRIINIYDNDGNLLKTGTFTSQTYTNPTIYLAHNNNSNGAYIKEIIAEPI